MLGAKPHDFKALSVQFDHAATQCFVEAAHNHAERALVYEIKEHALVSPLHVSIERCGRESILSRIEEQAVGWR